GLGRPPVSIIITHLSLQSGFQRAGDRGSILESAGSGPFFTYGTEIPGKRNMHLYRTHTCGQLRNSNVGDTVRLSGWVFRRRDHGHFLFIDLRDHYGITQIVFHPERSFFDQATRLRYESVITITGKVIARGEGTINP